MSKTPISPHLDIGHVGHSNILPNPRHDENEMLDAENLLKPPKERYGRVNAMIYIVNYVCLISFLFLMGFGHIGNIDFNFMLSDNVIIAYMTLIGIPNIYLIWKNRSVRTGIF